MTPRRIDDKYFVSPQIDVTDMSDIAKAGFKLVICNRPNEEVPTELHADVMKIAAEAAGLDFEVLPLTHQTMTPNNIRRQADLVAQSDGPVLAYCASGTRSTIAWALGQAGQSSADDIIAAALKAGYNIEGLRYALS